MTKYNNRLKYWDIAKGVAIILMLIGHVRQIPPCLRVIIFSFHMPFFFIANAFFIKNYNIVTNAKKSLKSLLLPYGIVCILSAAICVNINNDITTNYQIFKLRIIDMFVGMSKISTHFAYSA